MQELSTDAGRVYLVSEARDLEPAAAALARLPLIAVDTETAGLDEREHGVHLLCMGTDELVVVVDTRKVSAEPFRPLLEGRRPKVLQNAKFDYKMLRGQLGIRMAHMADTMLCEQLLTNGRGGGHSLAHLAQRYLGIELDKSVRTGFVSLGDRELSEAEVVYAARDVATTYRIFLQQAPKLKAEGLDRVARVEGAAIGAFGDLEYDGLYLDVKAWRTLLDEAQAGVRQAREALDETLAGAQQQTSLFGFVDINYESDEQLRNALMRIGVNVPDLGKRTLAALDHPVGRQLLDYRGHQKVISAYGESFLKHVHPRTGRLHADFRQIGAPTGRTASKDPNLQSIKGDPAFRACFRAPDGRKMVTADYAGCELRILAHLAREASWTELMASGGDLHAMVASRMFRQPVSKQSNPALRERAKAINFGLVYGMGAAGLARQLSVAQHEAEGLMDGYFKAFPAVQRYLQQAAEQALAQGWCATIAGRKLWFRREALGDPNERAQLVRIAKNMPIQGTGADMLKLAMARVREAFAARGLDAFLVNQVHDELVVECDASIANEVAELVSRQMQLAGAAFVSSLPMTAEASVSDQWAK